jgi:hypothetical protein
VAPAGADTPSGHFELIGRRCVGTVIDRSNPAFSDMVVELETAGGKALQSSYFRLDKSTNRYDFSFDLDHGIDLRGFLTEDLAIYAVNAFGARSKLRLDGSTQLSLIREFSGSPRDIVFDLDFTPQGNSQRHIKNGFSHPEQNFTWSDAPTGRIEVATTISNRERYELTISCSPFLSPPTITSQRMLLRLNGYAHADSLDGKHLAFLSFRFPSGSLDDRNTITLEFEFPDCFRPVDVKRSTWNTMRIRDDWPSPSSA